MKLTQITVGGFANVDKVTLSLSNMCALLAYNNFGKSNVLSAIMFGLTYMKAEASKRTQKMMSSLHCIPINNKIAGNNFIFQIEGEVNTGDAKHFIEYEYSFAWPQNNIAPHIVSEQLKIKCFGELKAKSYIKRSGNTCSYLSSELGRCSTSLKVESNQLALSKLSNYDYLFYIDILKEVLGLKIVETQSLADPKTFFRTINIIDEQELFTGDINDIPDFSSSAYYIYNLKKSNKGAYSLFRDAVVHLIPSIIDFEPVKIDLKKQVSRFNADGDVPFHLPEYLYDIRVKEKNLNQQVTIDMLSSGTKRIFYLLLMTIAAELNNVPLLLIEELENSIHPSLFQKLLSTLKNLAGNTRMILTSHSPYLLQYLKPELLYVGIPNKDDVAIFKKIKNSKINSLVRDASANDMSLGDYLFDLLGDINNTTDELVKKIFER